MNESSWEECLELLDRLPSLPTEQRAAAIETLLRNPQPAIRESALRTGAAVISDERLESLLREEADDVLRNAGLEMLKLRGARSLGLAIRLLHDSDPDVVLQAVLVLGHIKELKALEPLRGALFHSDMNVVQAAIESVGRLGDSRAVPDLLPFLKADPWLQMATIQALGDLRTPDAIEPLSQMLTDLMWSEPAAEAIARTGGVRALDVLAAHWLRFHEELTTEQAVGWIAHVLEGLKPPQGERRELREALTKVLHEEGEAGEIAARSLLAMGPGPQDDEALDVLLGEDADESVLPACLVHRFDLLEGLWDRGGKALGWAFRLCSRSPQSADIDRLAGALGTLDVGETMVRVVGSALEHLRDPRISKALVENYIAADEAGRERLAPLLMSQAGTFQESGGMGDHPGLSSEDRWVLHARMRLGVEDLLEELARLPDDSVRAEALGQALDYEDLIRSAPWEDWLERSPEEYLAPAAGAAAQYELRDLLPVLRTWLGREPLPHLIRVVGELRDSESLDILVRYLDEETAALQPLILESIGRIGGPEARAVIRRVLDEGEIEPRIAYRALSLCATEDDDALFRSAVGHSDWYVRLACVEVLGRFGRPENLAALSQLAGDSVGVVAQRAIATLERF